MKNFNRDGGGGRDRKFGGDFKKKSFSGRNDRGGFGGDRGERPEMHKAICADCGSACEVPFKPSGNKPVLCSNCFKGSDRSDNRRDGRREGRDDRRFGDKQMFKAVCSTCGNECEVPFRPTGDKPVYCSNCFKKGDSSNLSSRGERADSPKPDNHKLEERLEAINSKLDKIMKLLNPSFAPTTTPEIPKKNKTSDVKEVVEDMKKATKDVKEVAKDVVKAIKKDYKKVVKTEKKIVKKIAKKLGKK